MEFAPWAEHLGRWARARGHNVILADSLASTNDLGRSILHTPRQGEVIGWILALHQRQGRGRRGRSWVSPRGAGVYASRMLHVPSRVATLLPLALGVALCEGLAEAGYRCRLKWPNDLLLGGAKLGGILLHSRVAAARAAVVAGFGINRSHRASDLPRADATSLELATLSEAPPLADLSARLADAVDAQLALWGESEAWQGEALVARYAAWSAHAPGDSLRVSVGAGETVTGRFAGLGVDGRLRLETDGGERLVTAGDLHEEPR